MGLPTVYAIIGGKLDSFKPLTKLYRAVAEKAGHKLSTMPIAAPLLGMAERR